MATQEKEKKVALVKVRTINNETKDYGEIDQQNQ